MKLKSNHITSVFTGLALVAASIFLFSFSSTTPDTFAEDPAGAVYSDNHHVMIFDNAEKLSVKTDAGTVAEVLERAGIVISEADTVEPGLDTTINSDNFYINIYRAHPAIITVGTTSKYVMTSSYDPTTVAADAGIDVYDGDTVEAVVSDNFLEAGSTATYKVNRNGGRTITVEEAIPFPEEMASDPNMDAGESKITQVGEDGAKVLQYKVNFIDGVEVSRELVSEKVTKEPVARVTTQGTKTTSAPTTTNTAISPEQAQCANWARQAGVSEADLSAALFLIYHESGCRVDAANASGAYGIPQALPGSKMASAGADWRTNPVTQIRWMAGYVSRYGGWQGAYSFWLSHHWY
ncbi:G5 domain-containing protein [Candidatus Saccharibacteria bacterium]|nr:G5 domain-containing protein [Candidatus Saccharibacteria bacterium]